MGISAKISGKPQIGSWVPRFPKNYYLDPWVQTVHMEYEPNVRKFTNNLILFQCKGLFFDGIFNRPYCVHYQWLLLESRTMGGGQGLLLFIYPSVCSTRFLGVFCHTQELLLQIKKLFSISKLPDSIVETIPLLPEKEIHATTHSEY